ncbi:MAG TPA: ABC transporter substrate-binding protein [Acidimicrobiales bacterium]|nr:ABC transporter substrate-binding protein [Acidimicrobiales bacterium]
MNMEMKSLVGAERRHTAFAMVNLVVFLAAMVILGIPEAPSGSSLDMNDGPAGSFDDSTTFDTTAGAVPLGADGRPLTGPGSVGSTGTGAGGPGSTGGGGGGGGGGGNRPPGWKPAAPGTLGVDDKTLTLGYMKSNIDEALAAFRASSGATTSNAEQSFGDPEVINRAVIEYVNARGGIAGRQIKPVVYDYDGASFFTPSGRQRENQQACETWTKDNKVFAVNAIAFGEELMVDCVNRARTPGVFGRYHPNVTEKRFASVAPYYYLPFELLAERRETGLVRFLHSKGYFQPHDGAPVKVGIMVEDKPNIREGVARALKPELARLGFPVAFEVVYPDINDSNWQTYALQMRDNDITHVVWSATTGGVFPFFHMARTSQTQLFWPKWGLGSDFQTVYARRLLYDTSERQLRNVHGMGWKALEDTGDQTLQSANAQQCAEAVSKYGQPKGSQISWEICEFTFFMRDALARAPEVSVNGLAAGVAALGDDFGSMMTHGGATTFSRTKHDGVSVARYFVYDPNKVHSNGKDKGLNVYVGPPEPVPG